jgi:hypothetical protein
VIRPASSAFVPTAPVSTTAIAIPAPPFDWVWMVAVSPI